jgi:hypothetical protein
MILFNALLSFYSSYPTYITFFKTQAMVYYTYIYQKKFTVEEQYIPNKRSSIFESHCQPPTQKIRSPGKHTYVHM